MKIPAIAEIQGLYGPIRVSEKLLQKIWLRQDFRMEGLKTTTGSAVRIVSPGRWNLQEGPDFKNAEVEIEGHRLVGDVEIHFHLRDWYRHRHHVDGEFSNVILHVALFAPEAWGRVPETARGVKPHNLVLLPWLYQNIEEYANDDALLTLEDRDHLDFLAPFLEKPLTEREALLREKAELRWDRKVARAGERLARYGWVEACHHALMEAMGYRRNRLPMIELAQRFPLPEMVERKAEADFYFQFMMGEWKLAGLRPANHPRNRLGQYLELLRKNPSWPEALLASSPLVGTPFPNFVSTAEFRKAAHLKSLREYFRGQVLGRTVGGNRLHTVICDAFLPFLAAYQKENAFPVWFHWYGGDVPDAMGKFLRTAELAEGRSRPICNGLLQGTMQFLMDGDFN